MHFGDLSDLLGRRLFLLTGCIIGFIGILVASRATSLMMVIGGQVLNGVGASCGWLCIPLLQELVPKVHRPTITAVSVFFITCAGMIAPIAEGAFILRGYGGALEGWRVGLYIGAGLYGVRFLLTAVFYHPKKHNALDGLPVRQKLLQIDWLGIALLAGSLTTFLVGISFGGNPDPWTSARVLGTVISGAVGLIGFCRWEWKGTSEGIIPHALFQHRNFPLTLLMRLAVGAAVFGAQAWGPVIINAVITQKRPSCCSLAASLERGCHNWGLRMRDVYLSLERVQTIRAWGSVLRNIGCWSNWTHKPTYEFCSLLLFNWLNRIRGGDGERGPQHHRKHLHPERAHHLLSPWKGRGFGWRSRRLETV